MARAYCARGLKSARVRRRSTARRTMRTARGPRDVYRAFEYVERDHVEKEEHLLKEALMHEQWLFTIEDFNGAPYVTGEPYKLWSLPPREVRTGALRLR